MRGLSAGVPTRLEADARRGAHLRGRSRVCPHPRASRQAGPERTFRTCDIAEAVATALWAAGGKNLESSAPTGQPVPAARARRRVLVYAYRCSWATGSAFRPRPSTGSTSNHLATPSRAPSPCSASACLAPERRGPTHVPRRGSQARWTGRRPEPLGGAALEALAVPRVERLVEAAELPTPIANGSQRSSKSASLWRTTGLQRVMPPSKSQMQAASTPPGRPTRRISVTPWRASLIPSTTSCASTTSNSASPQESSSPVPSRTSAPGTAPGKPRRTLGRVDPGDTPRPQHLRQCHVSARSRSPRERPLARPDAGHQAIPGRAPDRTGRHAGRRRRPRHRRPRSATREPCLADLTSIRTRCSLAKAVQERERRDSNPRPPA